MALGLLLPLVGLPVGLVFMMLADRRHQEVGRACVIWSIVGSVLHVAATAVTVLGMREALSALVGGARGALDRPGLGVPGL